MKELRQSSALHHAIDTLWKALSPAPRKVKSRKRTKMDDNAGARASKQWKRKETRAVDSSIVRFLQSVRLALFKDESPESALSGAMLDLSTLTAASLPYLEE